MPPIYMTVVTKYLHILWVPPKLVTGRDRDDMRYMPPAALYPFTTVLTDVTITLTDYIFRQLIKLYDQTLP